MKKLFLVLATVACSFGAIAQEGKMQEQKMQSNQKMKDCVMMKDGKMMIKKDGKMTSMEYDMTMSNGSVISPNGMVKMKDGKTMQMHNGDKMDMNGEMMRPEKKNNSY